MVHSKILLNSGGSILLNDGSSFLLLNEVGPTHAASGGHTKRQRLQIPQQQEQKQVIHVSQKLRLHPYILHKLKIKILLEGVNPLLQKLSLRVASFPNYTNNIIRLALNLDKKKSFIFTEKASEWKAAGDIHFFLQPSSFVGEVIYDPETNGMTIELSGLKYSFCNVPFRVFDSFAGAASKGAYFARNIKGLYDC